MNIGVALLVVGFLLALAVGLYAIKIAIEQWNR